MTTLADGLVGAMTRALRNMGRPALRKLRRADQRCVHREVRCELELRDAVAVVSRPAETSPALIAQCLRELAELNTPALLLNVVHSAPWSVVQLRPWGGGSIRFRGSTFLVDAGSEATEGVEAFLPGPFTHPTTLYSTAPDHPVHLISLEHHDDRVITGDVPSWLTHFTLVVNGLVVVRRERVLHERGIQVWAA